MRVFLAALFVGATALLASPVQALNQDDYVAAMGMMWRLQQPICPGLSFDPVAFVKGVGLHGDPETVRRRHPKPFETGYAKGTELLDEGGTSEYCEMIAVLFDGKHDFSGALKPVPDKPAAGLAVGP